MGLDGTLGSGQPSLLDPVITICIRRTLTDLGLGWSVQTLSNNNQPANFLMDSLDEDVDFFRNIFGQNHFFHFNFHPIFYSSVVG